MARVKWFATKTVDYAGNDSSHSNSNNNNNTSYTSCTGFGVSVAETWRGMKD